MPTGVALITPAAAAIAAGEVGSGDRAARSEPGGEVGGDLAGPRLVGVEYRQLTDAELDRRVRHRRAGAAGAQLHHSVALRIGEAATEILRVTGHVRVVADPLAVAQHHRVHCAKRFRVVGQFMQQGDDGLLAGKGDVEALKSRPLRRKQEVRQCLGSKVELLQVDKLVDDAKALTRALALVQGRRQRRLDPRADQPEKHRLLAVHLGFRKKRLAPGAGLRTCDPAVNSRLLYQLSYPGPGASL